MPKPAKNYAAISLDLTAKELPVWLYIIMEIANWKLSEF